MSKLDPNRPKITPALIERFRAYARVVGCAWGPLHIVMSDGNVEDDSIKFCIEAAVRDGDEEGVKLADLLLQMSWTQRQKLYRMRLWR